MLSFFKKLFGQVTENKDVLNQVVDTVKDKVANGNEAIGQVVDKVVDTVTTKFEEGKEAVSDLTDKVTGNEHETVEEATGIAVLSPLTGTVVELSQVADAVFASGALGKGVAIEPTEGKVVSPADATITTLFPSKHAIGLTTTTGVEILIHIGMDTVSLNGEGFTAHVAQGDTVQAGQLLVEFDSAFIHSKGLPTTTPVIVTNSSDFASIDVQASETVNAQDVLLTLIK